MQINKYHNLKEKARMTDLRSKIVESRKESKKNNFFYCKKCLYPSTKPNLYFNSDGVCSACTAFSLRPKIDWKEREKEFHEIMQRYKSNENYDCIVGGSGGKDSFYQVWLLKQLGYNPLVVTATTDSLSDIGKENIEAMRLLGVDHMEFTLNKKIRRKINKYQLKTLGDISWPEHVSIWTIPVKASVAYNIPLIIWGENGQNEYGGPASAAEKKVLDRAWVEEFGGLLGFRVKDLLDYEDIKETDLIGYKYPLDEDITRVGTTGLYLGHYFEWDGWKNAFIAEAFGFKTWHTAIQGSAGSYENLDNYQTGIHDYFKYLKYGFGRATDLVCNQIRRGRLSRFEGIEIIKKKDGEFPWSYLDKSLEFVLEEIDMNLEEFNLICDKFTNRSIFKQNKDGSICKDRNNKPVLLNEIR